MALSMEQLDAAVVKANQKIAVKQAVVDDLRLQLNLAEGQLELFESIRERLIAIWEAQNTLNQDIGELE